MCIRDSLYAGSGNATIDVRLSSAGAYNIFSGSGTDTLKGSTQNDTITILNAGEADNDSIDGHTGDDILQLSSGTHTITTDGNLSGIETIKAHKDGSVTDFSNQTENLIFIGNDGNDTLKGGTGNNQLTGGSGADTFNITGGTDIINDLQTTDIIINANGATANASNISSFIATNSTKNLGSAANVNLTAKTSGGTISVANATGTGGFNLIGSASADTLTGSGQDDTFTVSTSTAANSDTIDGGAGTDKLILSSGSHTFADNNKLLLVEQVQMNASDSTLDLSAQTEGFTISGGAGIDTIKGGAGNDIITGSGSNDVFHIISGTDAVTDLTTGDSFIVSASATLNAANISEFVATDGTSNAGTANLSADNSDVTIDMRLATSGGYKITGGTGADTFYGGAGKDTFVINSASDATSDTFDGGADTDTLELATGISTFSNNASILNIENIKAHASGGTINLSGQSEGFLSLIHI